jgi:hypothetical protein
MSFNSVWCDFKLNLYSTARLTDNTNNAPAMLWDTTNIFSRLLKANLNAVTLRVDNKNYFLTRKMSYSSHS